MLKLNKDMDDDNSVLNILTFSTPIDLVNVGFTSLDFSDIKYMGRIQTFLKNQPMIKRVCLTSTTDIIHPDFDQELIIKDVDF